LAQGQITSARRPTTISTGHANWNSGFRNADNPRPAENQITISLSRYMRESVPTIAVKRLSVSTSGR
jgi:hypothetical protein